MIDSTQQLFDQLDIGPETLNGEQKAFLDENGYLLIPDVPTICDNMEELREQCENLINSEGERGGWEGKEQFYKKGKNFEPGASRLGNLYDKDPIFRKLITCPEILAGAQHVIQGEIKMGGADLREPKPGGENQQIHIDWLPRESESDGFGGIVAMAFLDDVRIGNGAPRAYPGSHKCLGWPDDVLDVQSERQDFGDASRIETDAGSLMIMNLNLWHAGCTNITGDRRRSLFINVRERSLPQLLNFKKFVSPEVTALLSEEEQYILGVREMDPMQEEDSVGPGKAYRERFGDLSVDN